MAMLPAYTPEQIRLLQDIKALVLDCIEHLDINTHVIAATDPKVNQIQRHLNCICKIVQEAKDAGL